jgi:cellulose synthase/poly-beta-1,6-N-acetylglucosamine synthase-like glycosyltransferase
MRLLATGAAIVIAVDLVALHAVALYAVSILFLGARAAGRARRGDVRVAANAASAPPRIAALVVAHDEERVVVRSVRSLSEQRYPEGRFAVFVVADHCSDRTAAVASAAGATVFERTGPKAEGKAPAVAHGVTAVAALGGFDAIAIFDADNQVDPGFLAAIAARLEAGERVVQGVVDALNPDASWVAASSALGFWAIAAVAQRPREALGLSAPPMGTGFAMELTAAVRFLGDASSLTDDLELGCRLCLDRVRVAHEPLARVFDEKPTTMSAAISQRHRWMQGRWSVAHRYFAALGARAFGPGAASFAERFRTADVAYQLVAPSLLFTAVALAVLSLALVIIVAMVALGALSGSIPFDGGFRAFGLSSLVGALFYYVVPARGIARFRPSAKVWLCYALQPFYLVLSLPLSVSGWLTRRRRAWKRTPHGAG